MALSDEQWAFLQDVADLIRFAHIAGFKLTGGHLWREADEQARLVADGKSQTMQSRHLQRLAIDFNVFKDGKLTYDKAAVQPLGDYWEGLNEKNHWGGNWKFLDVPHFERSA